VPEAGGPTTVLSDLDGVLVDSRASVVRAWTRFAGRHRVPRARVLAATFAGPSAEVVRAVLGSSVDADAEAALVEAWQVADVDDVHALPGAADLLEGIAPERLAVVTSCSDPLARARLAAAGLRTPEVLVTAEDVRAGKPDPEGYLLAAERLGAAPADCVVLEDAPAGIRAGLAAGMRVVGVATTHPAAELARADAVIPTLVDVPGALGALSARGGRRPPRGSASTP
jgi:mannitol-1-/sugar-/sorbitol-6-phosphatase